MDRMDVYDSNRIPTGKTTLRGRLEPGELFLVVHICLFDSDGRMLIQKRHEGKAGWPGLWDFSAAGGALAGETSAQAAQRECLEELGYQVDLTGQRPFFTVNFERGFDDYYLVDAQVDLDALTLQEDEVTAVRWATREEILAMIDDGTFIPYHDGFVQVLFAMRGSRGSIQI